MPGLDRSASGYAFGPRTPIEDHHGRRAGQGGSPQAELRSRVGLKPLKSGEADSVMSAGQQRRGHGRRTRHHRPGPRRGATGAGHGSAHAEGPEMMLDLGAIVDPKPRYLVQYALMATAYATTSPWSAEPEGRSALEWRRSRQGQSAGAGCLSPARGHAGNQLYRQCRGQGTATGRYRNLRHRRIHRQRRAEIDGGRDQRPDRSAARKK